MCRGRGHGGIGAAVDGLALGQGESLPVVARICGRRLPDELVDLFQPKP